MFDGVAKKLDGLHLVDILLPEMIRNNLCDWFVQ